MWRGILSIVALLLMCGASVIIVPILVLPNSDLHMLVPVLKPLHQALACEPGEKIEYDYEFYDGDTDTHFRCVNASGRERDVDSILRTPANYAIGVFCLGALLMLVSFFFTMRQGMMPEAEVAVQDALQQSYQQMHQQLPTEMMQSTPTTLNASGQQQLDALNKLRQQGFITQDAYESAKKQIFDNFSAN